MANRDDTPRTIERTLAPVRDAIQPRSTGIADTTDYITQRFLPEQRAPLTLRTASNSIESNNDIDRYVPDIRQPLTPREINRIFEIAGAASSSSGNTLSEVIGNGGTSSSQIGGSRTSDFGGGSGISVIPGGDVESGNSNTLLIFLVILLGIGAGYWYYKKGGFNG